MGLLGNFFKTVIDVVETPVAVAKDVATLCGTLTDQKKSYTEQKLDELGEDWQDTKDDIKKL